MKLTEQAVQILSEKDAKATRTRIALALDFTERWVLKCVQDNKVNGPLTTIAALKIIKKDTGLKDSEILENNGHTIAA
jgi:hypothetical protein